MNPVEQEAHDALQSAIAAAVAAHERALVAGYHGLLWYINAARKELEYALRLAEGRG